MDFDTLDDQIAAVLELAASRRELDPNRPKPRLPNHSQQALHELALEYAERHLDPEEITAIILLVEKRQLAHEGASLAEDPDTPIHVLRDKIREFLDFAPGEASAPPEDVLGTRAALVRRLLTDQLDFISVAKRHIKVLEFGDVLDHIIASDGNQGRLGGKAAGLILAHSILQRAKEEGRFKGNYKVPVSYFVPSNGILEFIDYNGLQDMINVKYKPIEEVREEFPLVERLFKSGSIPPTIRRGLESMLREFGETPLVIRSSSLLEDRIGHAFSGKYKSLFIANKGPIEKRLADLEDAIAEIYASVFHADPIEYRRERGLIDFQEQMGILIQQVVGREVGRMIFPVFAGVAFSTCEMRWSPRIQRTDGMARLVLGLGTRAVDRTVADYPVLVALRQPTLKAVQRPDEVYRYSQHDVDVVDLREQQFESLALDVLPVAHRQTAAPDEPDLLDLSRPADSPHGGHHGPDATRGDGRHLRRSPEVLVPQRSRGHARSAAGGPRRTGGRGVRPRRRVPLHAPVPRAEPGLGPEAGADPVRRRRSRTGCSPPTGSSRRDSSRTSSTWCWSTRATTRSCPRRSGSCGWRPPWASSTGPSPSGDSPSWDRAGGAVAATSGLGIPVSYADICYTALLIEIARQKGSYVPDVSFGTHFFNDLVEAGIGYLPLYPDDRDTVWNDDILLGSKNSLATDRPDLRRPVRHPARHPRSER